ncbi:MAG: hypothetical protein EOO40_08270 [Deltaproteobacteria bacterium]|nr:MAG: hypothetical protein EOO40_08270 [Deltaproteobacteria bacterium]
MQPDLHAGVQSGAQQRRAILTRAVQAQVIPQLLQRPALRSAMPTAPIDAHVKRLAALALQATSHEVVDFVTGLMENGFDAERLYLDLLTPTAVLRPGLYACVQIRLHRVLHRGRCGGRPARPRLTGRMARHDGAVAIGRPV